MSDFPDKPKKDLRKENKAPTFSPEAAGSMKRHPIHMSIDELLEQRESGVPPKIIINPEIIYTLASLGNTLHNIAKVLGTSQQTLISNEPYHEAYKRGMADMVITNRVALVDKARNGELPAMIYLDKLLSGDRESIDLNVSQVPTSQLTDIPNEELIRLLNKSDDLNKGDGNAN